MSLLHDFRRFRFQAKQPSRPETCTTHETTIEMSTDTVQGNPTRVLFRERKSDILRPRNISHFTRIFWGSTQMHKDSTMLRSRTRLRSRRCTGSYTKTTSSSCCLQIKPSNRALPRQFLSSVLSLNTYSTGLKRSLEPKSALLCIPAGMPGGRSHVEEWDGIRNRSS